MKILITGSKGQLATEIQSALKAKKCEIGPLDEVYGDTECLALNSKELDISDFEKAKDIISLNKPDILINCAAFTDVDACEAQPERAMAVNSIGARNLAIICASSDTKLVHISTDYVFSGTSQRSYSEWDICDPKTVYGKSKLLGEQYIREFSKKYFILRTSWLYSSFGNNFVKTVLNLMNTKKEISVVNDQFGNPTSANDLAYHILKLAITNNYGTYHCTGEGVCTWYDFAKEIVKCAGVNCKVIPVSTLEFQKINFRAASRPKNSALENLMLKSTGQNKMRAWNEALKFVINDLLRNKKH